MVDPSSMRNSPPTPRNDAHLRVSQLEDRRAFSKVGDHSGMQPDLDRVDAKDGQDHVQVIDECFHVGDLRLGEFAGLGCLGIVHRDPLRLPCEVDQSRFQIAPVALGDRVVSAPTPPAG